MEGTSSVARLQQAVALLLVCAAAGLWWWLRDTAPVGAVVAALALLFVHAWVLALEFVLMHCASRADPTPRPRVRRLVRAWWGEVVQATRVFGWRQPFAWRREPDQWQGRDPSRPGIVFVHGFMCNRGFWAPWLREARARGHACAAVNLEPMDCSIDDYVAIIERAVTRMAETTGRAPVLVCHSMGGLAARAWLRQCGDPARLAHVVTIGTPHAGTWLARFSRRVNGLQMRVGCDWLQRLGPSEAAATGRFTCWFSNCDNIVFPPSTATLPGADNRFLPGIAHVDMAFQPELMQDTFALLARL